MRPESASASRWGLIAAGVALALILLFAFVPDPLFRQRVIVTDFDNVEAMGSGVPVYFRGAEIGSIRAVTLDPASRGFSVRLGVARAWRPSPCSFARIVESNPLTTPRVELVSLETPATTCATMRREAGCEPVPPAGAPPDMIGCRRAPDLFETAAAAIGEVAAFARTTNAMAIRAAAMFDQGNGGGGQVMRDTSATLAALSKLTGRLDRSLAPGRGDIALTLANVRRASGTAASFDIASLNATLGEVHRLVAQNQANVAGMLAQGKDLTEQSRNLLENVAASLTTTSTNLSAASGRLDALSERLSADPSYVLRGQRFADPPAPAP